MAYTKFHKLYESFREYGEKETLKEINDDVIDIVMNKLRQTDAGELQLQFDHIFGPSDVRIAIPMIPEVQVRANEMMMQVHEHGWTTAFETKVVKQKERRGGGEEVIVEKEVATPIMQKKVIKVIPKGPRAGERIERVIKEKLPKIIKKLLDPEWFEFWQENQTFLLDKQNADDLLVAPQQNGFHLDERSRERMVIVTRAPIDVLRMSDHEGWGSCHSQPGTKSDYVGEYFFCAVSEAAGEGAIAYIVSTRAYEQVKDKFQEAEIFEDEERGIRGITPISRLRIRHVYDTEDDQSYAVLEDRGYGRAVAGFGQVVERWLKDKQSDLVDTARAALDDHEDSFVYTGGSYADTKPADLFKDQFGITGHHHLRFRHEDVFGTGTDDDELGDLGLGGPDPDEVLDARTDELNNIEYSGYNCSVSYTIDEESWDNEEYMFMWEVMLSLEHEKFEDLSDADWRTISNTIQPAVEDAWGEYGNTTLSRELGGIEDVDFYNDQINIRFSSTSTQTTDNMTDFRDVCRGAEDFQNEHIESFLEHLLITLAEHGVIDIEGHEEKKKFKETLEELELKHFTIASIDSHEIEFSAVHAGVGRFSVGDSKKWTTPFVNVGMEHEKVLRDIRTFILDTRRTPFNFNGKGVLPRDAFEAILLQTIDDEMNQGRLPLTKMVKGQGQMFADKTPIIAKIFKRKIFGNMRTEFSFFFGSDRMIGRTPQTPPDRDLASRALGPINESNGDTNIYFRPTMFFGFDEAVETDGTRQLFVLMLKYLDQKPSLFAKAGARFFQFMVQEWWTRNRTIAKDVNLRARHRADYERSLTNRVVFDKLKPGDRISESKVSTRLYQIELKLVIDKTKSGGIDAAMNRIRSVEGVTVISHVEPEDKKTSQLNILSKIKFHPLKDSMTPQTYIRTILVPGINKSATVPGVRITDINAKSLKRLQ